MCGIVGAIAISERGRTALSKIETATRSLAHRGPDNQSTYRDQNIAFGHSRLSIIDTSEKANQPFTDFTGRYTIVYNGEFYNYMEHRQILESKGVQFSSKSDTEVLLQLYINEGKKCLEKVNGFFSLAIYDKQSQTVFLARDRMGIKPLVYYQDENQILFASEIKALLEFGIPTEIDTISLFTYLQLNYVPAPYSMLQGIKKLEPSQYIEISNIDNKPSAALGNYYQIPFDPNNIEPVSPKSYKNSKSTLKHLLSKAVEQRLIADVPTGAFLSGGIDSSVISLLAAQKTKHLNTFSIGYADEPYFDETQYAQLVAKKWKTEHTVFSLTNDDLYGNLHTVLDSLDEPFADSSALAVNILSQQTRKHIKVALSGDGADEIFSGYNKHSAEFKARNSGIFENLAVLLSPVFDRLPQSRNSKFGNLSRQISRFSKGMKLSHKDRYWAWATFLSEEGANYLIREKRQEKNHRLSDTAFNYKKRKDGLLMSITKSGNLNDVLLTDAKLVLPNDMLQKVDSMSMAHSLEVRTPFLDHHIVEFAYSLPVEYKINANMKKKILQDTFQNLLPPELYKRPKQGFEVPLLKWFQTELKSKITDDLLQDNFIKNQGIFNDKAISELKTKVFSLNPGDSHATIWALIVFQHWWKKHLA